MTMPTVHAAADVTACARAWAAPVLQAIARAARSNEIVDAKVEADGSHSLSGNDILILLKPEIVTPARGRRIDLVLTLVAECLAAAQVGVVRARAWPGDALRAKGTVRKLHWHLDRVAREGLDALSPLARARFLAGRSTGPATEGAFETLRRHPGFDAATLEAAARAAGIEKLAHNSYAATLAIDGDVHAVLNPFWPGLLEHLTQAGGIVLALHCRTDAAPAVLRSSVIGAMDPAQAAHGTLRARLLADRAALGLDAIDVGRNGVHVSPGLVEGVFALRHFFCADDSTASLATFPFERRLQEAGIPLAAFRSLGENPDVEWHGDLRTVFDLTEGLDADDAFGVVAAVLQRRAPDRASS